MALALNLRAAFAKESLRPKIDHSFTKRQKEEMKQTYSNSHITKAIRLLANGSKHPDQMVYADSFFRLSGFNEDNGNRFLKLMRQVSDLGNFKGKSLLEVGCGFGWDAATQVMIGAKSVVATDILPSMIDGLTQSFETLNKHGIKLEVKGEVADGCNLPYEDETFDGVYSLEAIEHVHDLDRMFDDVIRVLRPGGRFVILNDSNALNTEFREATFKMWVERDESEEHAEFLKTVRPVEHANAEPYALMRERIVRAANPSLSNAIVSTIVAATAGMVKPEIQALAANYTSQTVLPLRPKFKWCRNPETGEYAERLLDPFELAGMFRKRGLKTSVGHGFKKFPFSLANNIQLPPLNRFLYDRRGLFYVVGTKPA
jgi:ubiquinone/menaquinone biosynthesis C-methylase UbiE